MGTREIKFRAWDKIDEIMHDVAQIEFGNWVTVPHQVDIDEWELSQIEWDDIELIEFTGLRDKNGVEIYEGDLLAHKFYSRPVEVFFRDGCFHADDVDIESDSIEVIGNIYENPELLNG